MIRVTAVASLTLLLLIVLYLPAAHPPERFLQLLRQEHALAQRFWGPVQSRSIMERMLTLYGDASASSPVPTMNRAWHAPDVDAALAAEMGRVNQRLFNNAYFRSIEALLALASYRCASLLQWLPVVCWLAGALVFDGFNRRLIRSKEFKSHSAEVFGLCASGAVLLLCGTVLLFVVPVVLPATCFGLLPVALAGLAAQAAANFHRSTH